VENLFERAPRVLHDYPDMDERPFLVKEETENGLRCGFHPGS
jgi:hypothetical protein